MKPTPYNCGKILPALARIGTVNATRCLVTSFLVLLTTQMPSNSQNYSNDSIGIYNSPAQGYPQSVIAGLKSDYYNIRIKNTNNTSWRTANVLKTATKSNYFAKNPATNLDDPIYSLRHEINSRYFENLWGCSHSYVNFEMLGSVSVDVEVTRPNNGMINSSTKIYPEGKATNIQIVGNKLTFTMPSALNLAIDINGEMGSRTIETDAIRLINSPIHTLSVHGNPAFEFATKPSATAPGSEVYYVNSTTTPDQVTAPNADFTQPVMYFRPGIHNIGANFKILPGKKYYIPGDAIVYGTFNSVKDSRFHSGAFLEKLGNSDNVRIFGHGTISGEKLDHWELDPVNIGKIYSGGNLTTVTQELKNADPSYYTEQQDISYRKAAVYFSECLNSGVEGLVIANPANHSLYLFTATHDPSRKNNVSRVKIFAWRVNSDGGGINDSSVVQNCFYRVQDDGFYPKGIELRNNVLWSDANGACLRLDQMHQLKGDSMLVENIDIIFRRNTHASHSAAIELPRTSSVSSKPFVYRNILISDPNFARAPIRLELEAGGGLSNVTFSNVRITGLQQGLKNILDTQGGVFSNIRFENLNINGTIVTEANRDQFFTFTGDPSKFQNISFVADSSTPLNRSQWTFTASSNTGMGPNVRDDNNTLQSSRWDGGYQHPGQWFQVDMKSSQSFDKIVLDNTGASGDYPREYQVYVSNMITAPTGDWGTPIASGINPASGSIPTTTIQLGQPFTARHIKIAQKGSSSTNYWSIYELNVYGASSPTSVWAKSNIDNIIGSSTLSNALWTTLATDGDIDNDTSDRFFFTHQNCTGNQTITANVSSVTGHDFAKAGVMFRDGIGSTAKFVSMCVSKASVVRFQYRTATSQSAGEVWVPSNFKWVRITRNGRGFTGAYATSAGGPWTNLGSCEWDSAVQNLKAGIAASGYLGLSTSQVGNVTFVP